MHFLWVFFWGETGQPEVSTCSLDISGAKILTREKTFQYAREVLFILYPQDRSSGPFNLFLQLTLVL